MKKLIAVILTLSLCFSMASCMGPFSYYYKNIFTKTEDEYVSSEHDNSFDDAPYDDSYTEDYSTTDSDSTTPILYKATDSDGSCVWLLGSIHIGVDEMYPLPDYVIDAYNEAESLAVECNILTTEESYVETSNAMLQLVYSDDTTISDHISPELYEKAVEILTVNETYSYLYDLYMPTVWMMIIEQLTYEDLGYDSEKGIDMNFLNLASSEGKEIIEIESVGFQYGMLANFSPELQEFLLASAVEGYYDESSAESYQEMIELWCSGDEEAFAQYLSDEDYEFESDEEKALYEEYNTAMVTDRNIGMADFAEDALIADEQVFICVGAAHVIGEGGIADLLSSRGYTVELIR